MRSRESILEELRAVVPEERIVAEKIAGLESRLSSAELPDRASHREPLTLRKIRERLDLHRPWFLRPAVESRVEQACRSAQAAFGVVQLVVPTRMSLEELGDALELIHQLGQTHAPAWKIYLKIATTVGWLALNVVREVSSAVLGRKSA